MAEIMKKLANMKKPMIAIRSKQGCGVEDHGCPVQLFAAATRCAADECTTFGPPVAGLVPAIHAFLRLTERLAKTWVAGTSPATGIGGWSRIINISTKTGGLL